LFEDEIERLNFSLQAAAVLYVDEWILCGGENVTRCDDIGTPEVHDAVAVRYRVRQRKDFHGFAVVKLTSPIVEVSVAGRRGRFLLLHSCLHILVADDGGSLSGNPP